MVPAPPGIHSDTPVPGHQPVMLGLSVPFVLCTYLPTGFENNAHTQDGKSFNFYVGFYFEYGRLNALEFIRHVSSHLFLMASRNLKSHACS